MRSIIESLLKRTGLVGAGLAFALAVPPEAALAQGIDIPALMTDAFEKNSWSQLSYSHLFESDVDLAGEVSREGVLAGVGHRFQVSDDVYILAQATYIGAYYDFSGAGSFGWDDIHSGSLVGLAGWKLSPSWTLLGGGLVRWSGEGSADFGDAFNGGGLLGASWAQSERLSLGLLFGVTSTLEDDISILPVPMVDWRFADDWKFHFGLLAALAQPGIGPELSFQPCEQWELGLGASFQRRRFRLDDDGPNADGIGEESSLPIYARIRFRPLPALSLDLYGGASVRNQLTVEDDEGDEIADSDFDTTAVIGLRGQFLF